MYTEAEVNHMIAYCNKPTVIECMGRLNNLSHAGKMAIHEEYKKDPDIRFGDTLLVALSNMEHSGRFK